MAIAANKTEEKDKFEFEVEGDEPVKAETKVEKPEIEVEDDTPVEDRGRTPMPAEIVKELDADELEEYSEKVKLRLKQFKKVWNDERREKEKAQREQQEALNLARGAIEENKRLKGTLAQGETTLVGSWKTSAELELAAAKKAFTEAYAAGEADKVADAQEKLAAATYKLEQVKAYRPALQPTKEDVEQPQDTVQKPYIDAKTDAWQKRNPWFGTDDEMTSTAMGLHLKLTKQNGAQYANTDEYWRTIDDTMRRRFPENFEEAEKPNGSGKPVSRTETKPATVVAPASRSTSPKKLVLRQSQINIAKRLGLTPEQYAREFAKLENQ